MVLGIGRLSIMYVKVEEKVNKYVDTEKWGMVEYNLWNR